ncbi:MAG: amidohydrolase [Bacteroidetes bacterium]|nr:MAG: amidohydrolase [Bacteroidota bacterium]
MKRTITAALLALSSMVQAQETVYPAAAQNGLLYIKNGTAHVGNGQIIENASILIDKGKIVAIGQNVPVPTGNVKVYDVSGQHIYPGLILCNSALGLKEIASGVRGSNDYQEIGDVNPNISSAYAYNADSKMINVLRSNGILLAHVVPQGNLVTGTSSVVQLDAWSFEDAVYAKDNGMHIDMPTMLNRPSGRAAFLALLTGQAPPQTDAGKEALNTIEAIKVFLREAKAYAAEPTHANANLRLEAALPLFEKKQKLYLHANEVKQMLVAIDFVKEFGFDVVIVGGTESYQIADLLKQNNIAVILDQQHRLPSMDDDDVDQPYKTPAVLQKAGVLFALNDEDENTRYRNLAFNAGTAAAYGLSKEEALMAITLNAAKILGIESRTGSLELGKDANIVVSQGDILDVRTNQVTHAFIQGRTLDLTDKQKLLNERYKMRYGIK